MPKVIESLGRLLVAVSTHAQATQSADKRRRHKEHMRVEEAKEKAHWSVMVYIAADEVLANFAIESLKQLKSAAGSDVVVAAQFDCNLPQIKKVPRYVFDGTPRLDPSIKEDVKTYVARPKSMADPDALTAFIDWAGQETQGRNGESCLFLWGHGPELLLDASVAQYANRKAERYLKPQQLREALERATAAGNKPRFDLVALDACSMSMIEMACELQEHADFMLASQEEVPDFSLPYGHFLELLRKKKDRVEEISEASPGLYNMAYEDFIFEPQTGMKGISLSSLRLANLDMITDEIHRLVQALMAAIRKDDDEVRTAVLRARKEAKGFVGGVFVDLFDFCALLRSELTPDHYSLATACGDVCDAIAARGHRACVTANQATDSRCHGLSIYFPYLTTADEKEIREPFVKGGTDILNKGGTDILNKGGTDILNKVGEVILLAARHRMIEDIEREYGALRLSERTRWNEFIVNGWSPILWEKDAADLDLRYSARQCEYNVLSSANNLPPPGAHAAA